MSEISYPPTARVDQVDDYHGTLVADPYRWLEETDSPQTREWIAAQNALTFGFLAGIPARERIRRRLAELWDYPRARAPLKRGGHYFQLRNTGLQNQDVLYVMEELGGEARVLLDPNLLSADGTVALSSWSVSDDGRWLAYAASAGGSDWLTWHVREVATGRELPDTIERSKFSAAAWSKDGSGFYYSRYAAPQPGQDFTGVNYDQKLCFHRLGDPQEQDRLVYERPDHKEWGFDARVSDDGRYLVLHVWEGTDERNRLFFRALTNGGPVVELIPEMEATYFFLGNDGPVFYLQTNLDAPNGRVIAADTRQPERDLWRTLIPEGPDALESMAMVHDEFVGVYLHDAYHQLRRFNLQGHPAAEIPLPTFGSIPAAGDTLDFTGRRTDDAMFYSFCSFLHPATVYRYDMVRGESELIFAPQLRFDAGAYLTQQVFVTSQDGTRIPMFLTHRHDLRLDGQNPTLLYGYGGFNIALTPLFDPGRVAWLELGGVLAWSNLRGGGEYGQPWHRAGMLDQKQNVFDDFSACARYLTDQGITSTPRLAIMGRSNGGLLVGASLTQHPELFGAAIAVVGVMDMLRFVKFTIGWGWVSDYGSPDDPEQFKTLYAYSPLHNVHPGTRYPPTLVMTADHDDRVAPGHSFKFAAALQAAQAGPAPALIRVQTKAGHGAGRPTQMLIDETADIWAFLVQVLGMEPQA